MQQVAVGKFATAAFRWPLWRVSFAAFIMTAVGTIEAHALGM
jgi:hypothetical protein